MKVAKVELIPQSAKENYNASLSNRSSYLTNSRGKTYEQMTKHGLVEEIKRNIIIFIKVLAKKRWCALLTLDVENAFNISFRRKSKKSYRGTTFVKHLEMDRKNHKQRNPHTVRVP